MSLGILTGVSYSLSELTAPSLLLLPSATTGFQILSHLEEFSIITFRALSSISAASFLLAYTLSPRQGRHPYLIWATLLVAGAALGEKMANFCDAQSTIRRRHSIDPSADQPESGINGEEVAKEIRKFRKFHAIKTGTVGLGFAAGLVGIWGDAFGVVKG
ncbi:MAG: hypothetical protein M1829_005610 [Trizodia sp. TS-e1964]|nr:MAG: hypothetical protein M1829_005610 [Trizodia sp. TS-e1964]